MAGATVTVRGHAERRVAPTSAVLHGRLVRSGSDRQSSFDELVLGQQRIAEEFGDAVTFTRVTSHETRDDKGWQVHQHTAALELVVDEVGRVAAVIRDLVDLDTEVQWVDWRIEDDHPVQREVRRAAVQDAIARATDYADAVDLTLGPLGSVTDGSESGPVLAATRAERGGGEPVLAPQPVHVSARAEVCFELVEG